MNQASFVIVIDEDHVLGFRRLDGSMGFPGGKVEPNETPEEAAIRECKEETGYEIVVLDYKPYVCYLDNSQVFYYLGRISGGKLIEIGRAHV